MSKICTKCEIEKEDTEFRWRDKANNKRTCWCKSCFSNFEKEKWKNSPVKRVKHSKQLHTRRIRNGQYVWDLLKENPCVDCGETNPIVLEFDHLDPKDKEFNICDLIYQARSLDILKNEIDKCEVVCANCHRIRTAEQFNFYKYIVK